MERQGGKLFSLQSKGIVEEKETAATTQLTTVEIAIRKGLLAILTVVALWGEECTGEYTNKMQNVTVTALQVRGSSHKALAMVIDRLD